MKLNINNAKTISEAKKRSKKYKYLETIINQEIKIEENWDNM